VQIVIAERKLRDERVCHRRVGLLRRVWHRHGAIRQSRLVLLVLMLGGERVRHVERVLLLLLLLLIRIAHDDLKKVELEKSRRVETSVRRAARAVAFVVGRLDVRASILPITI
jgi:hypothetical protein|tara:strand:- start:880 stop:1218 length:339 start_codon:yes stop_codon:yes gene_type:complete